MNAAGGKGTSNGISVSIKSELSSASRDPSSIAYNRPGISHIENIMPSFH